MTTGSLDPEKFWHSMFGRAEPSLMMVAYRIADAQGWVLGETLAQTQRPE